MAKLWDLNQTCLENHQKLLIISVFSFGTPHFLDGFGSLPVRMLGR